MSNIIRTYVLDILLQYEYSSTTFIEEKKLYLSSCRWKETMCWKWTHLITSIHALNWRVYLCTHIREIQSVILNRTNKNSFRVRVKSVSFHPYSMRSYFSSQILMLTSKINDSPEWIISCKATAICSVSYKLMHWTSFTCMSSLLSRLWCGKNVTNRAEF